MLVVETEMGTIDIDLLEEAAPEAVRAVVRLTRGPLVSPATLGPEEPGSSPHTQVGAAGFYDGLSFSFTRPHVEIATETREPPWNSTVDTELDAHALGLDRATIETRAEAMTVLQRELLPEYVRNKKTGTITPQLRSWLDRWYADYREDFLMGVSRREINEALGYVYREGLASQPPERGAVALWPESPTQASLRLTILLADLPHRTGKWMVIGKVTRGLEVAETISSQPLVEMPGNEEFRPIRPVRIERARIECRPAVNRALPNTHNHPGETP